MVSALFWVLAIALVLIALAFLLPPLLARRIAEGAERARKRAALTEARAAGVLSEDEYRAKLAELDGAGTDAPGAGRTMAVLLAIAVPLAAGGLYLALGEPAALDPQRIVAPAEDGEAPTLDDAVANLAQRLQDNPDDLGGWMLLGRAYKTMERFGQARDALAQAYRLAPDDADVLVEYAETMTLASDSRRIAGEPRALLDRALALQPDHPRALWLLGIQAYQEERFADAAQTWQRLVDTLPPDAEVRASLTERIAEARGRAGLEPQPPEEPVTAAMASADAPAITVTVDIAPELRARIGDADTLFVFARAPDGPLMPLAVKRVANATLPLTVTLDDSLAMVEGRGLSTLDEVVIGARLSASGTALPQPGDLETLSDPIPTSRREPLSLTIDRVVQ